MTYVKQDIINKVVTLSDDVDNSDGSGLPVQKLPQVGNILFSKQPGDPAGRTTGDCIDMQDGTWYMVALYASDYSAANGATMGWVYANDVQLTDPAQSNVSDDDANSMLQQLATNDQLLYGTLLRCAYLISKCKSDGIDTSDLETQYNNILSDYNARQTKLTIYVKSETGTLNSAYDKLSQETHNVFGPQIGVIPLIPVIVVAMILSAVITYYLFKCDYDKGKANLQDSALLEKALGNLSPSEQAALKKNLNAQLDNAYNAGKQASSTGSTILTAIKWIGAISAGMFLIHLFVPKKD